MNPVERDNVCHHEAAHAAVAIRLGGKVFFIEFAERQMYGGRSQAGVCWNFECEVPLEQIAAVAAAGYAAMRLRGEDSVMELRTRTAGDRADLRHCIEEANGLSWTEREHEALFDRGASLAEGYLGEAGVARAWHGLADVLWALSHAGHERIDGAVVERIILEHLDDDDPELWQRQIVEHLGLSR